VKDATGYDVTAQSEDFENPFLVDSQFKTPKRTDMTDSFESPGSPVAQSTQVKDFAAELMEQLREHRRKKMVKLGSTHVKIFQKMRTYEKWFFNFVH